MFKIIWFNTESNIIHGPTRTWPNFFSLSVQFCFLILRGKAYKASLYIYLVCAIRSYVVLR